MSDTPSRSEIETALSGKQKLYKRKVSLQDDSDKFSDDFELETRNPRRQQVIGGDLTGVSGRGNKNSFLTKLSDIHLTNWIAALVVLCILLAFFWPHSSSQSIREITEQNLETKTETFYTESRIDEPEQTADTDLSFSRETDLDRANDFREQDQAQQEIEELLIKAKQHIAKNEYTNPKDNNALLTFREILSKEPTNSDATAGINDINVHFFRSGEQALSSNNENQATSILNTLKSIDAESTEYKQLSSKLVQWRRETQIAALLSKANTAEGDDNLILPADSSSLYFFKQVLSLDSTNNVAKLGIKRITNTFINRANTALLSGNLEEATGYLATAAVVEPDNPSIEIVRDMIANAEPIATQNQINRQENTPQITTENPNRQISANRTPQQQANEQAEFDQIYLSQGLDAYYQGDYDVAAALLQPLADKGVSRAQFRIGYMYYLGRGFAKNTTEADRVLRAALPAIQKFANEGRSWAQSDLGSLYEDGLVLPRDYSEALYWYRSAAEQGYPGAQTNLGIMYARGLGVTTSRQTAIEWFQRAAKQGDIAAIRNLESLGAN